MSTLTECVCHQTACGECAEIETQITTLLTRHRAHHDALRAITLERDWAEPHRPDYTLPELLAECRDELGRADRTYAWIAKAEPEIAWLAGVADRSFYATPDARTMLLKLYPGVEGHIWEMLLADDR